MMYFFPTLLCVILFGCAVLQNSHALRCQRAKGLGVWTPSKMPSWQATHSNRHQGRKPLPVHRLSSLLMSSAASIEVKMPALSSTMKEGKIVSWAKKVGDKVNSGDVLLVVESDKADMDVESFEEGFLAKVFVPEGGVAEVGSVVALMVESEDAISTMASTGAGSTASAKSTPVASSPSSAPAHPSSVTSTPASASGVQMPAECRVIKMPALSSTMKEGKIVSWSKKIGDKVNPNDVLLVVESDKADMDVESFDEGFLAYILTGEGQVASIGHAVGLLADNPAAIDRVAGFGKVLQEAGGDITALGSVNSAGKSEGPSEISASSSGSAVSTGSVSGAGRPMLSGYAKSVAFAHKVDPSTLTSTRGDGVISSKDVFGALNKQTVTHTSTPKHPQPSAYISPPGVVNASPMARKAAAELKVDISKVPGTGNFNRVTEDDVLIFAGKQPKRASSSAEASPQQQQSHGQGQTNKAQSLPVTARPDASLPSTQTQKPASSGPPTLADMGDQYVSMDGMQKAVVKNMEKSLAVPVFRVSREICTDHLDALYAQLKTKGVTMSALIAKAVANTLTRHPLMNAVYVNDDKHPHSIKYNKDANVAMAVAIDGGLITPTLIAAQSMDLFEMSRKWKDLVERAKAKKLSPAEYSSGTITISNLGMFGVAHFDAILPPNQGTILAISAALPRVVQLKNGYFGVSKFMTVSATCDHRHIYGAHVAEFLRDLAAVLEDNVNSLTMG